MRELRTASVFFQGCEFGVPVLKTFVIGWLVVIAVMSWLGLELFETSLWLAYAVMAFGEAVLAVVMFFPRWRNRRAAVALGVLATFQLSQSVVYEIQPYTSSDPVIRIEVLGVLFLCVIAAALIAAGPSLPVDG